MSSDARPTWTGLAPLLRGAPLDRAAVWDVMVRHTEFAYGAMRRVIGGARDVLARHDGLVDPPTGEALAWAREKLFQRVVKDPTGLPVAERRDGTVGDAAAWFQKVWANLARDWCKAQRRQWRREEALDEAHPPAPAPGPPNPWDRAALKGLETLLAKPDKTLISDTQVLTYIALVRPDCLDLAMVQRAANFVPSAGSRSGATGLARPAAETWSRLQAWRETHDGATHTARARVELAWVLRSTDDGDPSTWRERAYADARTATVTVGKWAIRCADALHLPRAG